ncbi:uncharacterized protein LOC143031681 isoform X2 [Oratosquilla oratoria]|uniref:uncharacterized protein LOC143031681 isoform X2 n=1 Tax=Oratosquilla oratoria TaxID=337810 RepID=UPI003F77139E
MGYVSQTQQEEASLIRYRHSKQPKDNTEGCTDTAANHFESTPGKIVITYSGASAQKGLQPAAPSHGQDKVFENVVKRQGMMEENRYSGRHRKTTEDPSTFWVCETLGEKSYEMVQESDVSTVDVAYMCPYCDECLTTRPSFNTHTVMNHADELDEHRYHYMRCDLCGRRYEKIDDLVSHMQIMHKINLRTNAKDFKSEEGYARWKGAVERDCKIEVEKEEDYAIGPDIVTWYLCRRIGGKRCGFMQCARSPDGQVKAQCCLDFLGYGKMEKPALKPQEVILLPDEREGDKHNNSRNNNEVAPGASADYRQKNTVISVNREDKSADPQDPLPAAAAEGDIDPLLPSEDELSSIKEPELEPLDKLSIFSVSVCDWIKELMEVDPSSVLLYKTQGYIKYGLGKEDILLGLQTESQADILKKYGHRCIHAADSSSTIAPEVKLTSVTVLDESDQKVPVASLITSKRTPETLGIFFQALQKRIGKIQTGLFITDNIDLYNCLEMREFSQPDKIILYSGLDVS